MNPSASAPAATLARASSALVRPQILILITMASEAALPRWRLVRAIREPQLANLRRHVGGPHEALPDQYGMSPGGDHTLHVGPGREAALAHRHPPLRDARQQGERGVEAGAEGLEISVVDADHHGVGGERLVQLPGAVHFHQRTEPDPRRGLLQVSERLPIERRDDEEHGVCTGRARLPELILLDDEFLAEHRDAYCGPHGLEILEAAAEVLL